MNTPSYSLSHPFWIDHWTRPVGLLIGIGALFLLALLPIQASAVPSVPVPGVYSPAEGVPGAPAGSCAATPTQSQCPKVNSIVVSPLTDDGAYGPLATKPSGPKYQTAAWATNGQICGVTAEYPNVTLNNRAHGRGISECLPGYGVQYTELWVELGKYQSSGAFQTRGSTYGRRSASGILTVDHYADCFGRIDFNWRTLASAYTVINGVGYTGYNQKIRSMPCN